MLSGVSQNTGGLLRLLRYPYTQVPTLSRWTLRGNRERIAEGEAAGLEAATVIQLVEWYVSWL